MQTWVVMIVTAALGAGMLAFLMASPDQTHRVQGGDLGFGTLTTRHVYGGLGNAAEHHRALHAATMGGRGATAAGRRWLAAVPGSATSPGRLPTNVTRARGRTDEARRVATFVRWADDLPLARWRATAGSPIPVEGADRTWRLTAEVRVDVAQAVTRTRQVVLPVELTLRGSIAERDGMPLRWVVEDATLERGSGWLRAYADPVVVGSGTVDVVAPAAARATAQAVAAEATAALAGANERYLARPDVATFTAWLVERPERVRTVTGQAAPAGVRDAADGDPHGIAWADDRGDVVVDLARVATLTPSARDAAIRHAVTHLATRAATANVPALLAEGIALAEERRAGRAIVLPRTELAALDAAFGTRTTGIADLLAADPARALDSDTERAAAAATVGWLLAERGPDRTRALLAALAAGMPPDTALRRTVGLAPRGVERSVAAWVRAQLPADPEDTTR